MRESAQMRVIIPSIKHAPENDSAKGSASVSVVEHTNYRLHIVIVRADDRFRGWPERPANVSTARQAKCLEPDACGRTTVPSFGQNAGTTPHPHQKLTSCNFRHFPASLARTSQGAHNTAPPQVPGRHWAISGLLRMYVLRKCEPDGCCIMSTSAKA